MFVQFRHVDANEVFYHLPSLVGAKYQKTNLARGKVIGNCGAPYKGRALYRRFKPSDVVLIEAKETPLNAWMSVKP